MQATAHKSLVCRGCPTSYARLTDDTLLRKYLIAVRNSSHPALESIFLEVGYSSFNILGSCHPVNMF